MGNTNTFGYISFNHLYKLKNNERIITINDLYKLVKSINDFNTNRCIAKAIIIPEDGSWKSDYIWKYLLNFVNLHRTDRLGNKLEMKLSMLFIEMVKNKLNTAGYSNGLLLINTNEWSSFINITMYNEISDIKFC